MCLIKWKLGSLNTFLVFFICGVIILVGFIIAFLVTGEIASVGGYVAAFITLSIFVIVIVILCGLGCYQLEHYMNGFHSKSTDDQEHGA